MTRPGLMSAEKREDDLDRSLRPLVLDDFTGQAAARANLKVFIEAAKARKDALDHVLFVGPPGLGKTTLAQIVARELGVNFRSTSGPVVAKAGDLAAQLTNLEERDVLFIDEIHRLNPAVEEILYPAMEDFQLDLIIGEGPAARPGGQGALHLGSLASSQGSPSATCSIAIPARRSSSSRTICRRRGSRRPCPPIATTRRNTASWTGSSRTTRSSRKRAQRSQGRASAS